MSGLPPWATDVGFPVAFLLAVVLAYLVSERLQPGGDQLPEEFSRALRWLRGEGEVRVLAWWDYAAPMEDHTDAVPVLDGPSDGLRDYVDDPDRVRRWTSEDEPARVAAFMLAPDADTALDAVPSDAFDYVLVTKADLLKLSAMRAALPEGETPADEPFVLDLVRGDADWPVVYDREGVCVYETADES